MSTSDQRERRVKESLGTESLSEEKHDKIWTTVIIRDRPDDEIPEGAEFLIVVIDELLLGGTPFTDVEKRTAQSFLQVEEIVTEIRDAKRLSDSFILRGNSDDPRLDQLAAKLGLVKRSHTSEDEEAV